MSSVDIHRIVNTSTTIAVVFIVLIAASPVYSQIHWNRGWGAGGSVGKRPSLPPSAPSAGKTHYGDIFKTFSPECLSGLPASTVSITKLLAREVENLILCETEFRLSHQEASDMNNVEGYSSNMWNSVKNLHVSEE